MQVSGNHLKKMIKLRTNDWGGKRDGASALV